MKLEILGCYGNVVGAYRAVSFLVNDCLLLDAGTVTEILDEERLRKISHAVVSHTHIDHVRGLFPLVDEFAVMRQQVRVAGVSQVLDLVSKNLFNNIVWPDFTGIRIEGKKIINLLELAMEEFTELQGIRVKPIQVNHTVFATGFVVKEGDRGFMYTADTGTTDRFWEVARTEKGIEFIIADVSFPTRLARVAQVSAHMTFSMLLDRVDAYGLGRMPIYLAHIKPRFRKEILEELKASGRSNLKELEQGSVITL